MLGIAGYWIEQEHLDGAIRRVVVQALSLGKLVLADPRPPGPGVVH
jgi:hypothetical protein